MAAERLRGRLALPGADHAETEPGPYEAPADRTGTGVLLVPHDEHGRPVVLRRSSSGRTGPSRPRRHGRPAPTSCTGKPGKPGTPGRARPPEDRRRSTGAGALEERCGRPSE
ncbi:hypothetical protein GCM10010275_35010 [Streptomyces litmocidini]|nr:hypothetical protein GCM10010275_35010 [Streptomyces litmocidini]